MACVSRVSIAFLSLVLVPGAVLLAQDGQSPAPIERPHYAAGPQGRYAQPPARPFTVAPLAGVRVVSDAPVATVSGAADTTELRVDHGRANITVEHPQKGALILVDLPGGQVDLLADGFYTVNADTNTLRVLHGDAQVFPPGAGDDAKGVSVHEAEEIVLGGAMHAHSAEAADFRADVIQERGGGQYGGAYGRPYGYGYARPYAYPYVAAYPYAGWGYPYAGWGYPYYAGWGWDYPYYGYGWGYPYGWGLGFGWGGGYWGGYRGGYWGGYRGGYRGGYSGGYRGGGFGGGGARGTGGGGFHPGVGGGGTGRMSSGGGGARGGRR